MDNNNLQPKDRIKNILEKIQKNEVTIRSKTYFRLKLVALVIIAVLVLVVSVLLFSFIIFVLRVGGESTLIGFGINGWKIFFLFFPWKLLGIDIVLLFALEYLLRSFRFGYKIPVLYLLVGVMVLMIVSGYVIDHTTPLHDRLLHEADQQHLGPFNDFYENVRHMPAPPDGKGIFRGIITSISTTTASTTIQAQIDRPNATTTTLFTITTPYFEGFNNLHSGDRIFILGDIVNNQIRALRIIKAEPPRQ